MAKGVLSYLKGTPRHGLVYDSSGVVCGFADASYAGCVDTRRSTTGFVFMMHGWAIAWGSRTWPTVATSTCEAEYMAAGAAVREALWLRKLLEDLGYKVGAMEIKGDNQAALNLLENPLNQAKSKHIDVVHHFARERVKHGEVFFSFVPSKSNLANCFTKALAVKPFEVCVTRTRCAREHKCTE
jgi:hypothetical protein